MSLQVGGSVLSASKTAQLSCLAAPTVASGGGSECPGLVSGHWSHAVDPVEGCTPQAQEQDCQHNYEECRFGGIIQISHQA